MDLETLKYAIDMGIFSSAETYFYTSLILRHLGEYFFLGLAIWAIRAAWKLIKREIEK